MSNNLGLTALSPTQASKTSTINDNFARMDAAISENLSVSVSAGNATVLAATMQQYFAFKVTGASVAARSVTFGGTDKRLILVSSDAANTQSVAIKRGTTTYNLAIGAAALLLFDGTADGMVAYSLSTSTVLAPGDPGTPLELGSYFPGVLANNQVVFGFVAVRPVKLASATASSNKAIAGVAATGTPTFQIKKNGTNVASIAWSSTTGTFTISSDVTLAAGDILTIVGPSTFDATLANVAITLFAVRN